MLYDTGPRYSQVWATLMTKIPRHLCPIGAILEVADALLLVKMGWLFTVTRGASIFNYLYFGANCKKLGNFLQKTSGRTDQSSLLMLHHVEPITSSWRTIDRSHGVSRKDTYSSVYS